VTPLPGDRVEASIGKNEKENVIADILPRKNLMIRPAVANIDKLLIVLALTNPKPDLLLADKLIIQCEMNRIEPIIILNKADGSDGVYETELRAEKRREEAIAAAVERIAHAHALHDELEACYIPAMDFEKVAELQKNLRRKITKKV